ncbi:MAG: MbcA/ParS/Xre antitoxin family protein [Steroidobacteraceae bacterium]
MSVQSLPSRELPAADAALAGAGLRAFFRIAERWGLSAAQQRVLLGNPPPSTYFKWKKQQAGNLPRDVLERISYILGIYKALEILLPDPERADGWIKEPNAAPLFGGHSALEHMLGGNVGDLYRVRQYLDAQRG